MAKYAPDATLDSLLDFIALSDEMTITTGSPTTYAESHTGSSILARFNCSSGCFVKADGSPNGRKVTVAARTSGSITLTGTAQSINLNETAGSTLRYTTIPTAEQLLNSGGTVDTSAWAISVSDPT